MCDKHASSLKGPSPERRAAQAVDALRHGWALDFAGGPVLLPVETAIASGATSGYLLISAARAATLKLINQLEAARSGLPHTPILIRSGEPITLDVARPIADPSLDLNNPFKGPFKAEAIDWADEAVAAMEYARIAGILPAFMVDPVEGGEPHPLIASDLAAYTDAGRLDIITRARLPVRANEDAEIIAFRSTADTREHVALIIGEQRGDVVPLVRFPRFRVGGVIFA